MIKDNVAGVLLEADKNVIPLVKLENTNEGGLKLVINNRSVNAMPQKVKVKVHYTSLNSIIAAGAYIHCDSVINEDQLVLIADHSRMKLLLKVNTLNATFTSGTMVFLSGSALNASYQVISNSSLEAKDLKTVNCSLTALEKSAVSLSETGSISKEISSDSKFVIVNPVIR